MITLILIAITGIVSWMAFSNRKLSDRLILWPPAVDKHKQYDRLVTYGFIHADLGHLIFNMITLFFFGRVIENVMAQLTGSVLTYPLFYLAALVVSILPSYLKNQKNRITSAWAHPVRCRRCCLPSSYCNRGRSSWCCSFRPRRFSTRCSMWATACGWTAAAAIASTTARIWPALRSA